MNGAPSLTAQAERWLVDLGLGASSSTLVARISIVILIVGLAMLANFIARKIISTAVRTIVRRTKSRWDDIMFDRGVLNRLSRIAPALVVYFLNPLAIPEFEWLTTAIQRLAVAYMIGVTVIVLDALFESANDIYVEHFARAKERPIKGYVQLAKVFVYIVGLILIVTTILDRSPLGILSGIGALSAVLLLVFRDSILGFVSGLQLAGNSMVAIGDWIEMPKFDADGEVIDITLQSVKVQNWDKTITSIPIYSLVSDSFRNWRGMSDSGGRRIKRAINIDMRSVRFCDAQMLEHFKRYTLISDYVTTRQQEIDADNQAKGLEDTDLLSARRMTNLGVFRAYVAAYLRANPRVHQEMTFLVRHLPPGPTGLPVEIYVFSNDQVWAHYESIQADIFDHLLAVIPEFGLRVFQQPSGYDVELLAAAPAGTVAKSDAAEAAR